MSTVQRLDFVGRLDGPRRTPQGGLRVPANLTRTGVLEYLNADGSTRRELRPPEEVFSEDSLESLKLAPVTIGHPGIVGPSNFKSLSVGIVTENVKPSGIYVKADVLVQDGETVGRVDRRELEELSCGYQVRIDSTPGVWEGQPYDVVQRDIRYNHVGLGPRNWGRAGNEVRLHLDAKDGAPAEDVACTHYDSCSMTPAEIAKLEAERDTYKAQAAAYEADLVKARADAAKPAIKPEANAIDPSIAIDDLVAKRLDLLDGARAVLGASYDGRIKTDNGASRIATETEIFAAVITKVDSAFKCDGRSPEYLRARFDMTVEGARRTDAAHELVQKVSKTPDPNAAGTGNATESANALAKARSDFHERTANACTNAAPEGALVKPKA